MLPAYRRFLRVLLPTLLGAAIFAGAHPSQAMIFKSDKFVAQWDTWAYYHEGTYYLYYLITEYGHGEGFGVATSTDGVHWTDHGMALKQSTENCFYLGTGSVWKAADFEQSGRFVCNYSEHRWAGKHRRQNILFAWSTDLVHWNKYDDSTMFKIDLEHYADYRWDCIFAFPREEGGYWGTWTASSKVKGAGGVGVGYSEDGLKWSAMPMAYSEPSVFESGAIYPVGNRFYGMFGAERSMQSFVADQFTGPYRQPTKNKVLLHKGPTYFSRFLPTDDGLLVNHHAMTGAGIHYGRWRDITYASPLKRAFLDDEGVMRWKYWEGNEALKGDSVSVGALRDLHGGQATEALNLDKGVVIEAEINLPTAEEPAPSIAFAVGERHYEVRFQSGGAVEMGAINSRGEEWVKKFGADRQIGLRGRVSARLLVRAGMMEVYLDDHFIECWTMRCYGSPSIQVILPDGETVINPKLWQMSLTPANTTRPPQPEDIIVADFEEPDWNDWKAEGQAFGLSPSRIAQQESHVLAGQRGERVASSRDVAGSDKATGKLISPAFQLKRRHLAVLLRGGDFPETASVELIVASKTVARLACQNRQRFAWATTDIERWVGDFARLAIVDAEEEPEGFIEVDTIIQTNIPNKKQ